MEYLEKKTINDYNKDVRKVFNMLTITGNYRVIGSASLKKIKYNSDYDLEELVKEQKGKSILDKIYHMFKDKFIDCMEGKDLFITDFKCGLDTNGEPLRWNFKDIMKGYKILESGRKMTFQECILIKTMMKMDLIALIDGIYTEFSENYYFKIGNDANFLKHEQDPDHIEAGIKKSLDEYLHIQQNYWKSLKRLFSLSLRKKVINKKLTKEFIDFFNSDTGLINKCKNEFDILLIILEQNFRRPDIDDIYYNIKKINEWAKEANINIQKMTNTLLKIKKLPVLYKSIEKIRDQLFNLVNKNSYLFFKNKNLI
jgi:hypothetical protein